MYMNETYSASLLIFSGPNLLLVFLEKRKDNSDSSV